MLSLKQVLKKIYIYIYNEQWQEIESLLTKNNLLDSNQVKIINTLANIYVKKNDLPKALNVIQRGLLKHEFHVDVNFNAGVIYYLLNDFEKSLYHFCWVERLNSDDKDKNVIREYIRELKKYLSKEVMESIFNKVLHLSQNVYLAFPAKIENLKDTYIGSFFQIKDILYFAGHYSKIKVNINFSDVRQVPAEILVGEKLRVFNYLCKEDTIIPIMMCKSNQELNVAYGSEKIQLNNMSPKQYHYCAFPKGADLKLNSSESFIIGKPILSKKENQDKNPKLILNIFVDGLSQFFLNQEGLENVMPNTANFFQKGTICTKAHAAGEWTYVSIANYFTGKYTMHHRQFHPKYNSQVLYHQPLFSEVFQENGYFTTKIDGNWRCCPLYGYAKGFDRSLYQHGYYGMDASQVIMETMEHLFAFPNVYNFMWICLFDLHDINEGQDLSISAQVNVETKYRNIIHSKEKSVYKKYDQNKIEQYRAQLKKIDMHLANLYHYIEDCYSEEEFIISLFSDHGQSFLKNTDNYLDNHRTHIPMMFRGKNIPQGECSALMQSVDLFPTILHCIDKRENFTHDGNVPVWFGGDKDRAYTFTETLFPNKPYCAIFYEKDVKIYVKQQGKCTYSGLINESDFEIKVYDIATEKEITLEYPDKVQKYKEILFNHIEDFIEY